MLLRDVYTVVRTINNNEGKRFSLFDGEKQTGTPFEIAREELPDRSRFVLGQRFADSSTSTTIQKAKLSTSQTISPQELKRLSEF